MIWTEQDIRTLKRLWSEGQSGSQIAKVLRVSRNAVIGKVNRLNLPHRETVSRRIPVAHILKPQQQRKPRRPAPHFSAAPLPAEPAVPQTALRLTLMQLTDTSCRRPLGDPKHADFAFCGLPVKPGSRYCATHHSEMYSTVRTELAKRKARKPRRKYDLHLDDLREAA